MKYPIGTKIRRNGVSYTIIDHEPARMKRGDGTLSDGYVAKLDDIHQPDKPCSHSCSMQIYAHHNTIRCSQSHSGSHSAQDFDKKQSLFHHS